MVAIALLGASALLPAAGAERAVDDGEVRKHWTAVEFHLRGKRAGDRELTMQVPVGGEKAFEGTPITVRVLNFVPDFAMGTDSVTTKSMKDANPAAKIEILDGGKALFKGWAFRDFPDMHSFEDPRYTIKMIRAVAARE
jgi:hypothetical protein